jgi:hypothetical protein
MNIRSISALIVLAAVSFIPTTQGCDTCGCFIPTEDGRPLYTRGWFAGVGEQFTFFGTDLNNGRSAPNPTDQYLASSITQIIGGYRITDRFSIQLSIPLIDRQYRRPEAFGIQRGTIAGLGDIPIVGNFTLYRTPIVRSTPTQDPKAEAISTSAGLGLDYPDQPLFATVNLIGGIKLPTGDSSRIAEEFNEMAVPGAPPSGVHGHDLALGSGSVDGIVGLAVYARYHSLFFQADTQYAIRSTGSFDYRYANAISYSGGPGFLFINNRTTRLGLQAVISGEDKGRDRFGSEVAGDTGINIVYAGPRLIYSHRERITVELGADLPVFIHNTAFQTVPSFRIRAGFVMRY